MKGTIFLDTGVLSLYQSKHQETLEEIRSKRRKQFTFLSSEVNYIELFKHLCREKGKISAQVIMENLRQGKSIRFIPVQDVVSMLAGELQCRYNFLSMVDSIIIAEALMRNIFIYTTETHFKDIPKLKVKKLNF